MKKEVINFNKKTTKAAIKIQVGKKEYQLRNNEFFVNKALKALQAVENAEELDALDYLFDALSWLYGKEAIEEIATENFDIDWGEFVKLSIAMASGMTKEQYDKEIDDTEKNQ